MDLRTGEFTYDNTVMCLPGVGISYEFALRYRSRVISDGPLGAGWRGSYDRSIELRPDGTAVYHDENFGTHEFAPSGTGYAYLESYRARLSRTSTGFHLSFDDLTGMEFTLSGALTSVHDASGNALRFSQDSSGRTVSATDTVGRTIAYSYTASGQLALLASSDGRRVAFEYSDGEYGDLARVRMGRGESERVISFGYAPGTPSIELAHNLATLTDPAGNIYVENTYDADDRVVSQRYGTGTIAYEYSLGDIHADDSPMANGTGEVVGHYVSLNRATDRRGMIVEHAYDRFGHLTERRVYATGAETRVTSYAYDATHRLVAETLPQGGGTKYAYDARGNRVETRQKADMALPDDDVVDIVERREYDSENDRLTRRIAPDGTVTEYVYDSRLRLVETVMRGVRLDASSATGSDLQTTYEYDDLGQLTRTVDPSGRATSVAYEDGRPVSVTRHGSGASIVETYAYDAYGNIESVTDATGRTRSMTYDEYDRLVSATSAEGVVRSLAYDANGNITLESLSQSGTLASRRTRAYDGLDLPVTATESVSADVAAATATTYDDGGNVSAVTMPDGTVRHYEYDESGRPVRVSVEPAST